MGTTCKALKSESWRYLAGAVTVLTSLGAAMI